LQRLVADGFAIYDATARLRWAGEADVIVTVVHLARGRPRVGLDLRLDGKRVPALNSRLIAAPERPDPRRLSSNASLSFKGAVIYGHGFILSPDERDELVAKNPRNAERIFPYLGGQESNSSPTQSHDRYVINFGRMSLAEAEQWPDLIAIVSDRVKPERDRLRDDTGTGRHGKKYWWQFVDRCDPLNDALAGSTACLVTSQVSKYLVLGRQPIDRVLANTLYVFPLPALTAFAVLQSRIHEPWARLLSSSFGSSSIGAVLRYAASDCFETFPFPEPNPRAVVPPLEDIGQRLYNARAAYMVDTQQGLTQTYNRLKDADCHDPPIENLRRLHEDMDRAVLDAYGWTDVQVPPYLTPTTDEEKKTLETFEDQVIDRLFLLNAQRANEETQHRQVNPKTPTRKTVNRAGRSSRRSGPRPQTEIDFKVRGGG
jgi:hypothetical protein